MPSPFPGMDPFLESPELWPVFQHAFIVSLGEALQSTLSERYRLRTGSRVYGQELVLFTSVVREEHREERLELRLRASDRLITVVEMISPANRTTATGRTEYLECRDRWRRQGANLVELDFVLQGQPCIDLAADGLPEYDYLVCVSRARHKDRLEIYTATLQKRLPRIRLPLATDDRDTIVDLEMVFSRCYDRFLDGYVDYDQDLPVLLDEDDQRWVKELLERRD